METEEKMGKPFLTYEQQICKLVDEKKLLIANREIAIKLLKEHSYYALISGYKRPFKAADGLYKKKTSIEDIYALYEFDDQLRSIILRNILLIEKHIKSLIAYAFCEEYGDSQLQYLDATKYNYNSTNQEDINKLIGKLTKITSDPGDYFYIAYQKRNYGNIPLWVMMKALTLGSVSKMYSLLQQKIQAKVSKEFDYVKEKDLISMLDLLSRVRNVCAHNERLFDYNYNKGAICDTYVHKWMKISIKKCSYVCGKSDLFAILICFKYLINEKTFSSVIDDIDSCFNELLRKTHQIQLEQMYKYAGFPFNWKEIKKSPYKLEVKKL